jgi:RimJ/RimL family protein N-acetyltransferase
MQTSEGDSAIWGIHFEGRAVRKPFIRIVYSTFDPVRQLESLCEIAEFEFSLFAPLSISFFGAAGLPYDVDTTVYSAPVLQIRDLEKPPHYQRVAVRPESDVSFYPEYEAMYAELRQTNIEPFSSQESRESLQQAVSEGLMFRILIDGDTAGFFGLRKDYDRYLSGYYVIEEVLSTRFRGRGVGAAAQRRAIEELAPPPDLVIGMIDHRNVASWRTALRVGRKPVYSAYWFPL